MIKTDLYIKARDGFDLASILITPDEEPRGVIQFHAGTVIPKEFYLKYAEFLSEQGYYVVLFDYRGVGGSRPKNLKKFQASISDWGALDAPGVLTWIEENYAYLPVHLFAHSMGGQILGLMDNWSSFDKITVLASSSGNWHNFQKSYRMKISTMTRLFFPIVLSFLDYVPAILGLGFDWPKGVARDWSECSRRNMLMAEYLSGKVQNTFYKDIDKKITAYFISDDHMATLKTIPNFQKSYPHAQVVVENLEPSNYDLKTIGHFGIFKDWTKGKLWKDVAESLL